MKTQYLLHEDCKKRATFIPDNTGEVYIWTPKNQCYGGCIMEVSPNGNAHYHLDKNHEWVIPIMESLRDADADLTMEWVRTGTSKKEQFFKPLLTSASEIIARAQELKLERAKRDAQFTLENFIKYSKVLDDNQLLIIDGEVVEAVRFKSNGAILNNSHWFKCFQWMDVNEVLHELPINTKWEVLE